jgi:hypothetical protein
MADLANGMMPEQPHSFFPLKTVSMAFNPKTKLWSP